MRTVLVTPPEVEPVTLAQAKSHCRVSIDADDDLITNLIVAARKLVENFLMPGLITQTWSVFFDAKDCVTKNGVINLPLKPVQTVSSITSFNSSNESATFSSSNYRISGNRVVLNDSAVWPSNYRKFDSFQLDVTVGYGDAADDVPADIRQAILLLVGHWYENREAVYDPMLTSDPVGGNLPLGFSALIQPYKTFAL